MKYNKKNKSIFILIIFLFIASLSTLYFSGCSDTLHGEKFANQIPIVSFVNIPPDSSNFSRNPEIYWIGSDNDGQIDYYRYFTELVDTVTANGGPTTFLANLDDTMWTYINVEPTVSDPKTTNVISLRADPTNPVNRFLSQYIFLQAFDDRGDASEVVWKILNRNDNPPETKIHNILPMLPYINAVFPGGIITGIKLTWEGSDRRDYEEVGLVPPPFEYEWILYGPYSVSDSLDIMSNNIVEVFITVDAQVFRIGETLIRCDTTLVGANSEVTCDTTVFTVSTENTPFYVRDTIINNTTPIFTENIITNSSIENGGGSEWTMAVGDTIYNAFRKGAADTTVEEYFVFWIRARDDAFVADLTPEYVLFPVINPQYERNFIVVDFSNPSFPWGNVLRASTRKTFWYNTIQSWYEFVDFPEEERVFDTLVSIPTKNSSPDYLLQPKYISGIPVRHLLKHKVMILSNETIEKSGFATQMRIRHPEIFQAVDGGVNVWCSWRNGIAGDVNSFGAVTDIAAPFLYTRYFGVESQVYSAWLKHARGDIDDMGKVRIEDFVGTYSLNEEDWPSLDVDPEKIRTILGWTSSIPYIDSIAAYPEVNWSERSFGTEVMYLYKSRFGSDHPLGYFYSYDGAPVGHRFRTNLFRSVHFNFGLIVMDSAQAQTISNNVLGWLYPKGLGSSSANAVSEDRYKDAAVHISLDEAREVNKIRSEEAYNYKMELLDQ